MRRHGRCCHVVRRNNLPAADRNRIGNSEAAESEEHGNGPSCMVKRDWNKMLLSMRLSMACISAHPAGEKSTLFTRHQAVETREVEDRQEVKN